MAKDSGSSKDQSKNYIIIALAVVISSLLTYVLTSKNSGGPAIPAQQLKELGRKAAEDRNKKPEEDPYISGQVKNTIVKRAAEIQVCYKDFLKSNPKTTGGLMTVDWQIDEKGEVISPEVVNSQFGNKDFEKCMVEKIAEWNFPPPPSGLSKYVAHKFRFKEEESEEEAKK